MNKKLVELLHMDLMQLLGGLIAVVGSLLTWVIHRQFSFFIHANDASNEYIRVLVETNQKNTEAFLNAVNHQQTLNRDMQQKTIDSLQVLASLIKKVQRAEPSKATRRRRK